jgi:hypothetical protein
MSSAKAIEAASNTPSPDINPFRRNSGTIIDAPVPAATAAAHTAPIFKNVLRGNWGFSFEASDMAVTSSTGRAVFARSDDRLRAPDCRRRRTPTGKEAVANSQACPNKIVNPWQPAVKLKVHSDNGCNIALINPKGFRT